MPLIAAGSEPAGTYVQRQKQKIVPFGSGNWSRSGASLLVHRKGDSMSHHFSFPDSGFPNGDARLDLTDLYAFPKPGDAGKSILIMNVHPSILPEPAHELEVRDTKLDGLLL